MNKGIFYAVSTGPGKREMLTLQATEILRECHVIFYPESEKNNIALDSISRIPGLALSQKTLIPCRFSMTQDKQKSSAEYGAIVKVCENFLREGKSVAMLSIGDVSLYSTAARTARLIQSHGFEVCLLPGVNSFSAAACASALSLCEQDEKLSIIPGDAFYIEGKLKSALQDEGTKVLMKMGRHLRKIVSLLQEMDLIQKSTLVQKATLEGEKKFSAGQILALSEKDLESSYLSVLIVKG
ncbi:MAG: precorrin-2 C(20)-methyltransferase [Treponema sp.]|nr:precorrin-2 C(20)-methyltransferase [Treponema sp.]